MPVRIRLQRHGKKGKPFYWIVAADSRAKRDGRYLEKLGTYNPNTNPASIDLNIDSSIKWLENGAQPSNTARTLLSYKGALIKKHLKGGVKKGVFSQEEADKRFSNWIEEKQAKIQAKIDKIDKKASDNLAKRYEAEKIVNEKRIQDLMSRPEEISDETSAQLDQQGGPTEEQTPIKDNIQQEPAEEQTTIEGNAQQETPENQTSTEDNAQQETPENQTSTEDNAQQKSAEGDNTSKDESK